MASPSRTSNNAQLRPHILGNRQASSGPGTRPTRQLSSRDTTSSNRIDYLDPSAIANDASSSDSDMSVGRNTGSGRPQGHSRAASHPFPTLFPDKQTTTRRGSMGQPENSYGVDIVRHESMRNDLVSATRKLSLADNGSGTDDRNIIVGNCMTCVSRMRWPRKVVVFKCTICEAVNDLQPLPRHPEGLHPEVATSLCPSDQPSISVDGQTSLSGAISITHTQALIAKCINTYLTHVLDVAQMASSNETTSTRDGLSTQGHLSDVPNSSHHSGYHERFLPSPSVRLGNDLTVSNDQIKTTLPRTSQHQIPRKPVNRAHSYSNTSQNSYQPSNGVRHEADRRDTRLDSTMIFGPLEEYIVDCFSSHERVNSSFQTARQAVRRKVSARAPVMSRKPVGEPSRQYNEEDTIPVHLDPKILLAGDIAENGSWWLGYRQVPRGMSLPQPPVENRPAPSRTANIDWTALDEWYTVVHNAGSQWYGVWEELLKARQGMASPISAVPGIEKSIHEAQLGLQRKLLKMTEILLRRPGGLLLEVEDTRFLLIILGNPLLYIAAPNCNRTYSHGKRPFASSNGSTTTSGRHSVIIKRIVGLIAHSAPECQRHLTTWVARMPEARFVQIKDLVSQFLVYRLRRESQRVHQEVVDVLEEFVPDISVDRTAASLHNALGSIHRSSTFRGGASDKPTVAHHDDWQVKAAVRVLAILFAANNSAHLRKTHSRALTSQDDVLNSSVKDQVHARGQILPTSDFYVTLLDNSDLIADFEAWERRGARFAFCQYPFLLSIGAKTRILEHDAKRQMKDKARDAFFDSILSNRSVQQHLVLKVRRECLVEDSLQAVSEATGGGNDALKKGLRISFRGEEGVDAGGLRKEWFLLLVREVFNPDHGMFVYDEESQYCYFNPHSFETSNQFYLVGIVFGLAIYNSTIIDVSLPPFTFRKLVMSAPSPNIGNSILHPKPAMVYTLDDLAEYRPQLAAGLRALLEFEGDVESTFNQDFAIDIERYGVREHVPLCPGGDRRPVTNANRREYVSLYVHYLLDTAVSRQFEPFKRGFYSVCDGNALSLFRAEEIELLVRGSDEPLDIDSLQAVATYANWGNDDYYALEQELTLQWFWESFKAAPAKEQRRLLLFITGSDRIPPMGAASLVIKISCMGDDIGRYPTARTCFNQLVLWRYRSKQALEKVLWDAVYESEGFGLK